jgi:1-deoxy-D-xylulose-5-phosphate reductoisomerase
MSLRNITLLGATGSIGASTLDVVARHPDRYRVFALSARNSSSRCSSCAAGIARAWRSSPEFAEDRALRRRFADSAGCELRFGAPRSTKLASHPDCDTVMAAIVGAAGLASGIAAARSASASCSPTRKRS